MQNLHICYHVDMESNQLAELKNRLAALGMTRTDLARSLGVSLSTIYHWTVIPKYVTAYLNAREK